MEKVLSFEEQTELMAKTNRRRLDEKGIESLVKTVDGVRAGLYVDKKGVTRSSIDNNNPVNLPFNYAEWRASTVKPRRPAGYKTVPKFG